MDLVATRRFPYSGRYRNKGDTFSAPQGDARILIATGRARPAPVKPAVYATRDMRAAPFHPLDHDKDGHKGGSPRQPGDLSAVRAEYRAKLGKQPFYGWDEAEMRRRIAEG